MYSFNQSMKLKTLSFFVILFFLFSLRSFSQSWKSDYDSCRVKFNRGEIEAATKWLEEFIPVYKNTVDRDTIVYYEMVNLLGRCFLKQGFNVNAEEMFQEDVDYFRKNPKDISKSTYASSLVYLGYMYYGLKKYDVAERYFKEVLALKSANGTLKKSQRIALMSNLATISNINKKYNTADSLYSIVLQLKKDFYGESSLEYAKTLLVKGTLCKKMGKYSEAEPLYKSAIEIRKKKLGEANREYIAALDNLASLYKTQGRYIDLEVIYKQISQLTGQVYGLKSLEYSRALKDLADLYRVLSRFKEAEPICMQVLQIIEDTVGQNNLDYTSALNEIASLYKEMSEFNKAELYYLTSMSIYEVIVGEYHESYVKSLVNLAGLYRTVNRTYEAEPLYNKALSIYKKALGENSLGYADLLNDLGLFYIDLGHYEQAELQLKKSLEITEKLKGVNNPNYASTLDNLAGLYMHNGHLEQAEPILIEATRIRKEVLGPQHPLYANSLNNVGTLYETVGRNEEAKILFQEAIRIIKEVYGTKNPYYANALDNLAGVYEKEGNYQEAEKYISEALEINKQLFGERHVYYTTALNNLALIQTKLNKPLEAERLFKLNVEKTKEAVGDKHPDYASALSNLADLYEFTERYKEAEALYEEALQIRKAKLGVNHRSYTTTVSRLAGLYTATNDLDKADELWTSALKNYLNEIKQFFPSMSEKEKQQFYKEISVEFEQFNTYALLRHTSNPQVLNKMYDYQLATKALLLNASNKVRQRILNSRDTSLVNLYKQWLQQKEFLSKLYSLSKEEIESEHINIDSVNVLANELEKRLSNKSELFKNNNDTITRTWKNVQKRLKDGEAAIELIRFKKHDFRKSGGTTDSIFYAALIVTSDTKKNPEFVLMDDGNELETKYLNYYNNVVRFKIEDQNSYNEYWKKISEKIPGITKVYLSPDGVYNQININTIKNETTQKYVLDEVDIQTVSNTKDLIQKYGVRNSRKQIALFGNPDYTYDGGGSSGIMSTESDKSKYGNFLGPLPGTQKEVNLIGQMMESYKWTAKVKTGAEANEKNLKAVNNPKVLHIATHGFFDKDMDLKKTGTREDKAVLNPLLRSGLMLAGASVSLYNKKNTVFLGDKIETTYEDGILTAYEAMNLNLDSTDLVVLSACETGLGKVENGEGVYGLQRSFLIAGAESVIISLWKVDDATTQKLMSLFYNEWLKTSTSKPNSKRLAFRNAQFILKKEFPDPYYWGAFVMVGE